MNMNYLLELLAIALCFATPLLILFSIFNWKKLLKQVSGDTPPEEVVVNQVTETDSRFVEKKPSRVSKDQNRWGRWKLTFEDGHTKSTIGYLKDVIDNNKDGLKRYKEIV